MSSTNIASLAVSTHGGGMKTCIDCGVEKESTEFTTTSRPGRKGKSMVEVSRRCHPCEYKRRQAAARRVPIEERMLLAHPERTCVLCGETKGLAEFGKGIHSRDGYRRACLPCERLRRASREASLSDERRAALAVARRRAQDNYDARNPEGRRKAAREYAARRRLTDPDLSRKDNLKRKYGLTVKEWDAMFEAQGMSCAACGGTEPRGGNGRWHTDHCHTTGRVRGILCPRCNVLSGLAGDDAASVSRRMADIVRYLASFEETASPRTSFSPAFVTTFASLEATA